MEEINFTLRQRKLLNAMKNASGYITGADLSKLLSVSSRTIRSEITEINNKFEGSNIRIISKHRYGYTLEITDYSQLKSITKANSSFLTREERLRYIAFQLCMADSPLDIHDLADEMYVSQTTISHDMAAFRKMYLLPFPHIRIEQKTNLISLEKNERKKRYLLVRLFAENWDYNSRDNIFYSSYYIDTKLLNLCILQVNYYLDQYHITMEDPSLVNLELMLVIAIRRIKDGYCLDCDPEDMYANDAAEALTDDLLNSLESLENVHFNKYERAEIYRIISCCRTTDFHGSTNQNITYSPKLTAFADAYMKILHKRYFLDFSVNTEFCQSLYSYLNYLSLPLHFFNTVVKDSLPLDPIAFELAFQIEPLALQYYGSYLNMEELFYLCSLIEGALACYNWENIKTVLMCHYNRPIAWKLSVQIKNSFQNYLSVQAVLPMYQKDNYDFSHTDLILTTTDKRIMTEAHVQQLKISYQFSKTDQNAICHVIHQHHLRQLYRKDFPNLLTLLDQAEWVEGAEPDTYFNALNNMGMQLAADGYVDESYLQDIFHREALSTFINHPAYILVYSSVPARKTHILVKTFIHRIRQNNQKIKAIFMICVTEEDLGLIFKLLNELYSDCFHPDDIRFMSTKKEYLYYFKNRIEE